MLEKEKFRKYVAQLLLILILFFSFCNISEAQLKQEQGLLNASETFNRPRFNFVVITEAAVAAIAGIGLKYLWYKNFPKSKFHFFNDNGEWMNMDKVGHATSVYNISAGQYNAMRWCGVNKNSATLIGGLTGLAYLTIVEISDGFSAEWGFSKGDMAANIIGSSIFMGQQYAWGEQRIQMRFTYHKTIYSQLNPKELGRNYWQNLLKDYNGQTYWLSFNISSFLKKPNNFPRWMNADIGYGAEGMIGAFKNPKEIDGTPIPEFVRQRKLFFGIDGAITKKNTIPYPTFLNVIRMPSPVLEYKLKTKQLKGHLLYY